MWGPGAKPFAGDVLHVPDTSCYPRPLQAHVPILVGGSGERRTLRLVAELADACNLFGEPDVVARKVAVLRDHCAAVGRDPADVSVTHLGTVLVGDDPAHVDRLVEATRPPRVGAERHARNVHAGTVDQHVAPGATLRRRRRRSRRRQPRRRRRPRLHRALRRRDRALPGATL